ncbi:beta-1,4-galactosyltransferase 5-like [Oculina patagonica]
MSSLKVFYGLLLSGLVLYFLLYSFLVRKLPALPVVKIYFEDETTESGLHLQQYFSHETSLNIKAGEIADGKRFSPSEQGLEISAREEEEKLNEITSEKEQGAVKKDILLSFLEGLGMPTNQNNEQESVADISTNAPPRVNPNGASLPKLMKTLDEDFNLEIGKPCPTIHLNEVGLLEVDDNTVFLEDVERELNFVKKGGQWKPDCVPRTKVAIVVPFRDRHEHLYIFLRHMHQLLRWQMLEYRIFIVEQADDERFNRGMLMNVGFSEAMKADNFTCVVFHDVDLIPEDARNDYGCPSSPRHMSTAVNEMDYKLMYKTLFGGVEGFWSEHYRQVNGFPNRFWGWGGEDDDLYVRVREKRLGLTRPAQMIGRYTMLGHSHQDDDKNPERFEELRRSEAYIDMDGLNTLTYNVLEYQEKPLYTLISASLR